MRRERMEEECTQRRRERITGWQKQLHVHNHLIHQKNHHNVIVCSPQHRHLEPPSTTTPSPSEIEEETKKRENKSRVNKKYRKHRERKKNHRPRTSPVHNYNGTISTTSERHHEPPQVNLPLYFFFGFISPSPLFCKVNNGE
jgi:hypothetical protein